MMRRGRDLTFILLLVLLPLLCLCLKRGLRNPTPLPLLGYVQAVLFSDFFKEEVDFGCLEVVFGPRVVVGDGVLVLFPNEQDPVR